MVVDDGKLNGDASLRIGDDGCECVGVVVPDEGQFLLPNVFNAFTTVEPDGYGRDDDGRMSWKVGGSTKKCPLSSQ